MTKQKKIIVLTGLAALAYFFFKRNKAEAAPLPAIDFLRNQIKGATVSGPRMTAGQVASYKQGYNTGIKLPVYGEGAVSISPVPIH